MTQSLSKLIGEQLFESTRTQLEAAPEPPKNAMSGWSPLGSKLGEVNFQDVILTSPRLIEHFARTHSKGAWARHLSQSMEDYLVMISHHLPQITDESIAGYLERYHAVRFEEKEVTKRQYSKWLAHLTVILRNLDADAIESVEALKHTSTDSRPVEISKKARQVNIDRRFKIPP